MTRTMIAAAALSLLGASTALAGPQFTADTVQMQPGQEMRSGKLFVSDKGVRFEYQQDDGQMVAQVLLPSKNVMRVLFPVSRTYMEIDVPHGASLVETRPDVPCKASAEVECVKEGDDPANAGLVRWTIRTRTPQTMVRVWWDAKRKMAVREEYMDGRVMQATLRGSETYEGHAVEGWETVYLTPNGQYRRAMSLYSAELGLSVVDQMPGGSVRQLRNIQIGAPDPKLFVIPENFKKVETPVDAELARITPPEAQPSAPKTDARMTPQAGAQPTQPTPPQQPQPQQQQPGAFGPQTFMPPQMPMPMQMPQMQGPGMLVVPPAQPEVQPQAQPLPPVQPQQQPQPQAQPQVQPQAQPQPQPNAAGSFPGAAPWQQPPYQGPAPQWAQPGNGQPQGMQPPMYPGYGPQPMPPSPYTYPGQPMAPTGAPQGKGANAEPAPAPSPTPPAPSAAGQQPNSLSHYTDWGVMPGAPAAPQTGDAQPSAPTPPAYPGYGMWPGQFGPYGPGYPVQPGYPAQPTAPAPDKSSASAAGTPQVAPGTPNSTSAKGAKEP